jgi:hypothetical protein
MRSIRAAILCDGKKHYVELNEDGTARMLDHDEAMVRSFVEFGVEDTYQKAAEKSCAMWDYEFGLNLLKIGGRTSPQVRRELERARKSESRRVRAAKMVLEDAEKAVEMQGGALGSELWEVPRGFWNRFEDAMMQAERAAEELRKAKGLVRDWEQMLEYIIAAEAAALDARAAFTRARSSTIAGHFHIARQTAEEEHACLVQAGYLRLADLWLPYKEELRLFAHESAEFQVTVSK